MEIEMKIRGLMIDPAANAPIVILKDIQGDVMLPIWVGPFEANAIAFEIEKVSPARPMTHDLLRNLIIELGGEVRRIVVTDLRDNTFFAVIELKIGDQLVFLDARPSDAIALALRTDSPIFVNENVVKDSVTILIDATAEELSDVNNINEDVEWPDEIDTSDI